MITQFRVGQLRQLTLTEFARWAEHFVMEIRRSGPSRALEAIKFGRGRRETKATTEPGESELCATGAS